MRRTTRLHTIIRILRTRDLHRAEDIARATDVSVRTIYRDMDTLIASGLPIEGERGVGYRMRDAVTLPPLTLTPDEVGALSLGVAIVGESDDPALKAAARALADKIEAALPARAATVDDTVRLAVYPFASAARGFSHMATLRAAIGARQKLALDCREVDGTRTCPIVRPLQLDYSGRVWTLTAWCEQSGDFREFRVDLIEKVRALPELFVDEPGKSLADFER